ncbi:MAG: alpha/beta hydrolase [Alteromonadaceae bacterium]|nr:alpha/beta hydrolase [Alteromonadaceae bacterium]|tara:strand:+ start:709 stop:1728 length:1020 start_codon:yes stop_codon:yes gene_type:complete
MHFSSQLIVLFALVVSLLFPVNAAAGSDAIPPYNATLDNFAYPFKVARFSFESQGQTLSMAYMDVKPQGDPKATVVLLHGKNFSGFYWERIASELAGMSYRVIIPDQIGFGKSSKPEHYQYSFAGLANNTRQLLEHLNVKQATIVGHSMGGMLAVKLAKYAKNNTTKLILINPIGLEDYLKWVDYQDPQVFLTNELNKSPESIRRYQQKNYYDGKWQPAYQALLEPHIGQLKHPDYPRVAMNNALTYNPIFSEPIVYDLPQLTVPVTLIIGTRDRTGPGRAFKKPGITYTLGQYQVLGKQVADTLQHGRLIELDGLGHMPQFEDWQRFKAVFFPLFTGD